MNVQRRRPLQIGAGILLVSLIVLAADVGQAARSPQPPAAPSAAPGLAAPAVTPAVCSDNNYLDGLVPLPDLGADMSGERAHIEQI